MGISRYFRSKEELMARQEPDKFMPNSIKLVMNDGVCPNCGGDNVEWGSPEPEGNVCFRVCECKTCSTEWTERYLLTGIEEDPLGRNVLAFDLNGIKGHVSLGNDGLILHLDSDPPHIWYNILALVKRQEGK